MAKITDNEFADLARFIVESAGIQLDKGKEYLMEARLEPVLERYGLDSFGDLYQQALVDNSGKLRASIIDAITINETYFFRDNTPFDLMKNKIIPDLIDQKTSKVGSRRIPIKIWSAACSTGQEVYSLGMILKEMALNSTRFDINILGTDISNEAIARASYGKYNQFEIERGLGTYYLNKYFTQQDKGWRIKDEIRSMARFFQMDLNKPFTEIGTFDVILCRNVAIYFPLAGKIKLFQQLAKALNPEGSLLVGGSESLAGLANDFFPRHYLNGVFYQLRRSDQSNTTPSKLSPYQQTQRVAPEIVSPRLPKQAVPSTPIPAKPVQSETDKRLAALKLEQTKQRSERQETALNATLTPEPEKEIQPSKSPAVEPVKSSLLERLQLKRHADSKPLLNESKKPSSQRTSLLNMLKEKEEKKEHS